MNTKHTALVVCAAFAFMANPALAASTANGLTGLEKIPGISMAPIAMHIGEGEQIYCTHDVGVTKLKGEFFAFALSEDGAVKDDCLMTLNPFTGEQL